MKRSDIDKDIALSVDTGGMNGRIFLVGFEDGIIDERKFKMYDMTSKDQLGDTINQSFAQMMAEKGIEAYRLAGVGQGSAGVPDEENLLIFNSPTAPRIIQPMDIVPRVLDNFKLQEGAVLNDCGAGAFAEWLYGWTPDQVKALPSPSKYRNKPGAYWVVPPNVVKKVKPDKFDKVIYVTISTGENFGFVDENGELVGRPEAGHIFYGETDLFGNEIICNCGDGTGGRGHYEGIHSGAGFTKVILNGIEHGQIAQRSAIYRMVEQLRSGCKTEDQLRDAIPKKFYELVEAGDHQAIEINRWHNKVTARFIGAILGSGYRPNKFAIGGSMTKDMKHSILPAFALYRNDARSMQNDYNPNQRIEDQPVLAVCSNYGRDHVGLGAAAAVFKACYGAEVMNLRE